VWPDVRNSGTGLRSSVPAVAGTAASVPTATAQAPASVRENFVSREVFCFGCDQRNWRMIALFKKSVLPIYGLKHDARRAGGAEADGRDAIEIIGCFLWLDHATRRSRLDGFDDVAWLRC